MFRNKRHLCKVGKTAAAHDPQPLCDQPLTGRMVRTVERAVPVLFIADQWMTAILSVNPNLMSTAGFQIHIEVGNITESLDQLKNGVTR